MATLLKPRAVSPEPIPAVDQFERIRCPDCGHADPAPEGAALILSLEAPCPRCGGRRCEFVASADSLRRVA